MYAVTEEYPIVLEERGAKIESEVNFLRAGFVDLKTDQREMRQDIKELRGELHLFRVEMAQSLGAMRSEFSKEMDEKLGAVKSEVSDLKSEFGGFKTEVANRFGAVDASIETTKRWVIVSGVSAMVTLVGVLGTLVAVGHALKWF